MPGGGLGSSKGLCGHGSVAGLWNVGYRCNPEWGYRGTEEDGSGLVETVSTGVEKRRHVCIKMRKPGTPLRVLLYPTP